MRLELPQLKRVIEVSEPGNLLLILRTHKVPIASSCSGEGVCGTCGIVVEGDGVPPVGKHEARLLAQLSQSPKHSRMACLVDVPVASKTWVISSSYW